ncbi:MAG TPA: LON peptidase substrate-binding domain-containing protein [Roseiflexaceae bacterium]|nr:LON peptidase substrate-binding domain-containing protein [Roseiflexaceae bacterium]
MTQKMPLFPLNTVLYPSAPLPLHIFEERYKLMISRCLEQQAPFGVVLIQERDRPDTDPNVNFHQVGTSAQIGEGVKLEDGRYYLVATGQRRFRVQYLTQRAPYLIASVTYLPEDSCGVAPEAAEELRELYSRYWNALSASTGYPRDSEHEAPPASTVDLTYWMANRLQVDSPRKQRWLEADIGTRLREMAAALRGELTLLPATDSGPNNRSWVGPGSWN